jgi:hypothetical protein
VALSSSTDAERPDVVTVAGYRLLRGPDGTYVGLWRR